MDVSCHITNCAVNDSLLLLVLLECEMPSDKLQAV